MLKKYMTFGTILRDGEWIEFHKKVDGYLSMCEHLKVARRWEKSGALKDYRVYELGFENRKLDKKEIEEMIEQIS